MSLRRTSTVIAAALLVVCALAVTASAQSPSRPSSAEAVVTTYFQLFNAGFQSGDFTPLSAVYAPDATLTQAAPSGKITVLHGLPNIIRFYGAIRTKFGALVFIQDSLRSLAPSVAIAYEHGGSPLMPHPGHCAHIFQVKDGKIQTLDWVVFVAARK